MTDIWQLADIEEERFAAVASLLAIDAMQQSVSTSPPILHDADTDSSGEQDADDDWQTTMPSVGLHQASSRMLKDKFLDRLSEVFAREKAVSSRSKKSDSKHVAAAAWINRDCDSPTTILLAKNEGLDDRDRKLLARLQVWLRAISATGKPPAIEKDSIWLGSRGGEGLVEYYNSRLEFYISRIGQYRLDDERVGAPTSSTRQLQRLCQRCAAVGNNPTVDTLSGIVNLAYDLRYADWSHLTHNADGRQNGFAKVVTAISMLGRLRAAYECFKTTALSFPDLKSVKLCPLDTPHRVDIVNAKFRKYLRNLAETVGRKQLMQGRHWKRYVGASWLHVHAEMQILVSVESDSRWRRSAHRYIGTSRKLCFLCHSLLRNHVRLSPDGTRSPSFRARESHGKVYPLWTLPSRPAAAEPSVGLTIAAALIGTYRHILRLLSANSATLRPAIAESSAGLTTNAAFVGSLPNKLKREHLARQRKANSCKMQEEDEDTFGPKVKTVLVIRLPADGSEPKLVPIAFHALPMNPKRKVPEVGFYLMPDFREYWASCHVDRKYRLLTIENQPNKEIEGNYWVYRNENVDLPENKYIKRMLGIDRINLSRQFYCGDVFIVKFTENPKTFAYALYDIPGASIPQLVLISKKLFLKEWENAFMESELERDQTFEMQSLKWEADKEILYQRMTPVEREILKRMPPNTLGFLALSFCDDNPLFSARIKPSDDPEMVVLESKSRPAALDSMGWSGFHSSQL